MKSIIEYITEKFKISSKTVYKEQEIKDEINYEHIIFSKEDINTILEYAQSLKVVPIVISNKIYWNNSMYSEKNSIYLYFDKNWNQTSQENYLQVQKDGKEYYAEIIIDNKLKFLKNDNNSTVFNNIEEVFKAFDNKVPKDFYNKLKK